VKGREPPIDASSGDDDKALKARLDRLKSDLERTPAADEAPLPGDRTKARSALGKGLSAGTELVAAVLVGTFLGYVLDQWLGTKPWLMLVLLVFGMVAGFRSLLRLGMRPTEPVAESATMESTVRSRGAPKDDKPNGASPDEPPAR
jgi:ATP synthase protein I